MKVQFTDDWLKRRAKTEGMLPVAAGKPSIEMQAETDEVTHTAIPVFGRLISLRRRDKGLTVERLADLARVDLEEIFSIETVPTYVPEPRTVFQLADVLQLDTDGLLELSGNTVIRDETLEESAVKFAARCQSTDKLSREEKRALDDFIRIMNQGAKKKP